MKNRNIQHFINIPPDNLPICGGHPVGAPKGLAKAAIRIIGYGFDTLKKYYCFVNWPNIFQCIAILFMIVLTHSEYHGTLEQIEKEQYYLRVQKSFQNRQSFEHEYGPDWKQVIKDRIEEQKMLKTENWNTLVHKSLFIIILVIISVIHFVRAFYVNYGLDEEQEIAELRYNTLSWLLNFVYLLAAAAWFLFISRSMTGALVAYAVAIISLMLAILNTRKVLSIRNKAIKYSQWVVTGLCAVLYLHVVGLTILYYLPMIMQLVHVIIQMRS